MKRVLVGLIIALLVLAGLLVWMAGGLQSPHTFDSPAVKLSGVAPRAQTDSSTITVVTWNIAWGYGWGSEGSGKARPREHFEKSVPRIGEVLKKLDADIVLLQEIDFDSTRSHRLDQSEAIARAAGLEYVARASSWDANWVPFPYWPPSEHFGHMSSGGAVLSRFPVTANRVELLEKPAANPFWYNLFYLFRYIQRAELDAGGVKLAVLNTHLEAFDEANRVKQAEHLKERLATEITPLTLFGGDFNTVPPEQPTKSNYPDEPKTNHEKDRTLEVIRGIPGLRDTIPAATFTANPSAYYTFPAHAAIRKLDFIFAGEGFELLDARVAKEAGEVSDHLPVVVKLRPKR